MSNSFTSPPTFTDPQAVVAGQPISSGPVSRIGETINYAFGQGGITNVISQAWREGTCSQSLTTYQSMCEWYLPAASTLHQDLEVYIIAHGTGSIRLTLAMGGTSTQEEVALSGGSAHLYISTLSLASFSATFGTLTMEVKATSGQVKVDSIMARWAPLSSPLPTSTGAVSGLTFRPMGIDRLDTEQPLSARVGHRMLQNIEALRGRYRTWISWSAALNADRDNPAGDRPVEWLGGGDLQRLIAPTHIHWAETLPQTIYCAIRAVNAPVEVDIMGQRYVLSLNGWNLITVSLDIEPERINAFKLPIFRVGLDATEHNLIDTGWNGGLSLTRPDITALCMWGS
jgi:hypothetical protein